MRDPNERWWEAILAENAEIVALRERVTELQGAMSAMMESRLSRRVREFRQAMGLTVRWSPAVPEDAGEVRLAVALIVEEFFELLESAFYEEQSDLSAVRTKLESVLETLPISVSMPDLADALADLDYVAEGMRAVFGIDGAPIMDRVHAANMAKLGGPKRADGKHLKPPGWTPPDIEGALRDQGWRPARIEMSKAEGDD